MNIPSAICQHTSHEIHGHTEAHVAAAYSQSHTCRPHRMYDQMEMNVRWICNDRSQVDQLHDVSSHVAVCH